MYKKTITKKEKVKPSVNVNTYEKNKVLYTLSKPRSPHTIKFFEETSDPWFVDVIFYRTKSGLITDTNIIIAKDIPDWLIYLQHAGYTLQN